MRVPFAFAAGGAPPVTVDWEYGLILNRTVFGVPSPTDPISDFDYLTYVWNYPSAVRANRAGHESQFGRISSSGSLTDADESTGFERFRGGFFNTTANTTAYYRFDLPAASRTYRIYLTQGGAPARTVRAKVYDGDHLTGTEIFASPSDLFLEADERCDLGSWTALPIATAHTKLDNDEGYIEHTFTNAFVTFEWERVASSIIPFPTYIRVQRLSP